MDLRYKSFIATASKMRTGAKMDEGHTPNSQHFSVPLSTCQLWVWHTTSSMLPYQAETIGGNIDPSPPSNPVK
ncbi:hypothetical protein ANANG_G00155010 [Anguilla anguilla]|uniref:Uncharacterized protein n=1 Tax=Anguilla anguilla TaxID=7936 RepID=A0A9D3M7C9_ANGAN|nr:hypothetical protein ANANG_G00155010 [Anguilla anguilla]